MIQKFRSIIHHFTLHDIAVYAGNAAFFLSLSVLPLLALILGILPWLPVNQQDLVGMLSRILPEALLPMLYYILSMEYPISAISVPAVMAIWSASRGTLGILRGLCQAYEIEEPHGFLRVRLLSLIDTLFLMAAILVSLFVYVYGRALVSLLPPFPALFALFSPVFRFLVTTALLILLFSLLYRWMPNQKQKWRHSLPGAIFAGAGWMLFSFFYSFFVTYISDSRMIYGSLSMTVITVLWLYFCMEILFLGGVVNHSLQS